MEKNIEAYLENKAIENRRLYRAQIELTSQCNWRCRHCYIDNYLNPGLDKELLFALFNDLRKLGVFELVLTGGELLTRNDAVEIISYARKLGFKVFIFSNVSLLNKKIIHELKMLGVSLVSCTIFSMNPEIHDYVTQRKGSLKQCLDNIMYMKEEKLDVEIKTIITRYNINEINPIIDFCKENGFRSRIDYEIYSKSNGDKAPLGMSLSNKEFKRNVGKLDGIRGTKIKEHQENEYACGQIRCYIFIDAQGNVFPCEKFRFNAGNIKSQTVEEIWNSDELIKIHNIRWKDLTKCRDCKVNAYCQRCPGTAFMEKNDVFGYYDNACDRARIRFEYGEKNDEEICI